MEYNSIKWAAGDIDSNFENLEYNDLSVDGAEKLQVTIGIQGTVQIRGLVVNSHDYVDFIHDKLEIKKEHKKLPCIKGYFFDSLIGGNEANVWLKVDFNDFTYYIFTFIDSVDNTPSVYFKAQFSLTRNIINKIDKKVDSK